MKNLRRYAAAFWLAAGAAHAAGPMVTTTEGPIEGNTNGVVNSFLGVPYASPPVGGLRWKPPGPPANHSGTTLMTTQYSAYCPQGLSQIGKGGGSEDCLYLNVQVPASANVGSNLPVMVWIHGGGLTTGSGQEYDGSALVQENNVVFVSFNYRLGLLGFLAHPALAAEDPHKSSGNDGLLDQQAAIAWIRNNAAAFGGNPNSITIFGESAGGQSVIDQLTSPLVGKLRAAVIESGAYARNYPTQSQAQAQGVQVGTSFGCTGTDLPMVAACLRALTPMQLVDAVGAGILGTGGIAITPNVDRYVLPMQPFQALYKGRFARVPVIEGTNHDEYRLFISENDILGTGPLTAAEYYSLVEMMGGSFAQSILAQYSLGSYPSANYAYATLATDYAFSCGAVLADALISKYVPVYSYELNDPNWPNIFLPFDPNMPNIGDPHASELPYLYPAFTNALLGLGPANFTPDQQVLARTMRASWAALAWYGRPLSPQGSLWPAYDVVAHAVYSLVPPGPGTETGFLADHKCDFWVPYLLRQAGLPQGVNY